MTAAHPSPAALLQRHPALQLGVGNDAAQGDQDADDGAGVGLVLEDHEAKHQNEDGLEVPQHLVGEGRRLA